jgi:hypothetical protein
MGLSFWRPFPRHSKSNRLAGAGILMTWDIGGCYLISLCGRMVGKPEVLGIQLTQVPSTGCVLGYDPNPTCWAYQSQMDTQYRKLSFGKQIFLG